jgi:hypothetical protein
MLLASLSVEVGVLMRQEHQATNKNYNNSYSAQKGLECAAFKVVTSIYYSISFYQAVVSAVTRTYYSLSVVKILFCK